jgi:hypothetical protein
MSPLVYPVAWDVAELVLVGRLIRGMDKQVGMDGMQECLLKVLFLPRHIFYLPLCCVLVFVSIAILQNRERK